MPVGYFCTWQGHSLFSVCVQGKLCAVDSLLSNVLPREAGNDLTEFMEVGAFKGNLVEALPDWVPCRTAVYQCTQVPVPTGAGVWRLD